MYLCPLEVSPLLSWWRLLAILDLVADSPATLFLWMQGLEQDIAHTADLLHTLIVMSHRVTSHTLQTYFIH